MRDIKTHGVIIYDASGAHEYEGTRSEMIALRMDAINRGFGCSGVYTLDACKV